MCVRFYEQLVSSFSTLPFSCISRFCAALAMSSWAAAAAKVKAASAAVNVKAAEPTQEVESVWFMELRLKAAAGGSADEEGPRRLNTLISLCCFHRPVDLPAFLRTCSRMLPSQRFRFAISAGSGRWKSPSPPFSLTTSACCVGSRCHGVRVRVAPVSSRFDIVFVCTLLFA